MEATKEQLENFIAEINLAEAVFPPLGNLEEGDKQVADISKDELLKKIFSLCMYYKREADMAEVSSKFDPDDKEKEKEHSKLSHKADLFRDLFWFLVKDKHKLWGIDSLSIRKQWIVIKREEKQGIDILKHLFGG